MNLAFKYRSLVALVAIFFINSYFNVRGNDIVEEEDTGKKTFFANQAMLDPVFERLYQLEKSRAWKVNLVHVGDSHIQADFLTNAIRTSLQEKFGNGGYGFTFPYSLMRTNGTISIKYNSNATWKSRLNVSPVSKAFDVGLSGIGLFTEDQNVRIQLTTNKELPFNSIKVIYPTKEAQYQISLTDNPVIEKTEVEQTDNQQVIHRIRRGESLSIIAVRYKTTVAALKQENNLRSDNIQAGRTLIIPSSAGVKNITTKITTESVDYVDLQSYPYYSSFISPIPLNRISVFSRGNADKHSINGFVLENDKPGLIYHGIGVNGAKISDFNKYPLFFKQLTVLKPDLVIVAFGTNESYQKLPAEQYIEKVNEMVGMIRAENPDVVVLVMTPPPSMFRRRAKNTLIGEYSEELMKLTNVPVWNLYEKMDGDKGIAENGRFADIIARDKIHYTTRGYKIQGDMFVQDFLEAYNQFKERKEKK